MPTLQDADGGRARFAVNYRTALFGYMTGMGSGVCRGAHPGTPTAPGVN